MFNKRLMLLREPRNDSHCTHTISSALRFSDKNMLSVLLAHTIFSIFSPDETLLRTERALEHFFEQRGDLRVYRLSNARHWLLKTMLIRYLNSVRAQNSDYTLDGEIGSDYVGYLLYQT